MQCISCGAVFRVGAKYCVRCGAKGAAIEQPQKPANVGSVPLAPVGPLDIEFDLSRHARAAVERLPNTQLFIDTFGSNYELAIEAREYEIDHDKCKFQLMVQIQAASVDRVDEDTAERLASLVADVFFKEAGSDLSSFQKNRLIEAGDPVSMWLNDDVIY